MNFDETIFITGFPGFIAERLIRELAGPATQFFLLVQPPFVEKAIGELEKIAGETGVPPENFAIVKGDITLANLGMTGEDLETVRRETTDFFHLAAVYDLAVEKDLAYRVNVEGTRNVNELVRTLPELRRYNYVSTCYVAGKRTGRIYENDLEHDAGFRNFYEETKYLAEIEVEELKKTVPTTVYRPSVVVGDAETGETTKYDGIYYLILYLRRFPNLLRLINVGNREVRLNLVPVDFVVKAMTALSKDDRAAGKTVQLADPHPLTTEELFEAIVESLTGRRSIYTPPKNVIEQALSLPFTPPISGLPLAAVPYFFLAQTYDTDLAEELLARHALVCPNFRSYVKNLLAFVAKHPRL